MAFLTKSQILDADDIQFEDIEVPEWGGTVRVVGLNAKDAANFGMSMVKLDEKGEVQELTMDNFMAELLAICLTDENRTPLFSKEDVEALGKKNGAVVKRLHEVAARLSGLGDKAKKDAEKNSEGMPGEGSLSD